jgi:hypothetical protein
MPKHPQLVLNLSNREPVMNSVGLVRSNPQLSFRNQTDGAAHVVLGVLDRDQPMEH